jgi:hypothetical protein
MPLKLTHFSLEGCYLCIYIFLRYRRNSAWRRLHRTRFDTKLIGSSVAATAFARRLCETDNVSCDRPSDVQGSHASSCNRLGHTYRCRRSSATRTARTTQYASTRSSIRTLRVYAAVVVGRIVEK